jgi:hypothetical protein
MPVTDPTDLLRQLICVGSCRATRGPTASMPTHWRVSRCSIPRVCVRSSVKAVSSALAWLRTGIALFGRADIVQEGPSDSTTPPAQGRRLGGGAIASLGGIGLLVIFMIQNTERVRLDFLFWSFIWALAPRCGVGTAWGVGMVRIGRDAPSPASQGAPPSPTGLTLNRSGLPRRTATTLPGVSSSNLVAAGPALSSENIRPNEAHRRGHDGAERWHASRPAPSLVWPRWLPALTRRRPSAHRCGNISH